MANWYNMLTLNNGYHSQLHINVPFLAFHHFPSSPYLHPPLHMQMVDL